MIKLITIFLALTTMCFGNSQNPHHVPITTTMERGSLGRLKQEREDRKLDLARQSAQYQNPQLSDYYAHPISSGEPDVALADKITIGSMLMCCTCGLMWGVYKLGGKVLNSIGVS